MKKVASLLALIAFVSASAVYADAKAGETITKKKGCGSCHNPTKDQLKSGLGPSWQNVAKAYNGDKAALLAFFNGNDQPKVDAGKYKSIMKAQLNSNIKRLSDAEKSDLADYILSNK